MTKVFSFVTGEIVYYNFPTIYTASALTSTGKWIAGAVSQNKIVAVERCNSMAYLKIKNGGILSDPDIKYQMHFDELSGEVITAMNLAFERLP